MASNVQKPQTAAPRNPPVSATNSQQQNPQQQQSTSGIAQNNNAAGSTTPAAAKTNKPSDSRFKQQKLKAWQPILTAGTVLPTFFVIGIVFIPIGAVLYITSHNVQEHILDYTDSCVAEIKNSIEKVPCKIAINNETIMNSLKFGNGQECSCDLTFTVSDEMPKPVYVYYGLTNFYQNHRRYVKSRDDVQLLGNPKHTSQDCSPFEENNQSLPIVPCGAVANSLFNDTFFLAQTDNGVIIAAVDLSYTDIAWKSDREKKFFNPKEGWGSFIGKIGKPPYWKKYIYQLSDNPDTNGFKNESLMVWMRTAALPTFRKLHSRVNHDLDDPFKNGLPAGNYTVNIVYNYPVDSFDGRKRFIISNTSWAGGKNPFLGIAYMVVGSLCILTGFIFLVIHMKFGKSLTELASVN